VSKLAKPVKPQNFKSTLLYAVFLHSQLVKLNSMKIFITISIFASFIISCKNNNVGKEKCDFDSNVKGGYDTTINGVKYFIVGDSH